MVVCEVSGGRNIAILPGRATLQSATCAQSRDRFQRRTSHITAACLQASIEQALRQLQSGSLDEAERTCLGELASRHDNADALHVLGLIAYRRERYDESASWLAKAVQAGNKAPVLLNNYGLALYALKRLKQAEAQFRHALASKPDYAGAHHNLGAALKDQGELQAAAACFKRAAALDPHNAATQFLLGSALGLLGRNDQAVACFDRAIALEPDHAKAHVNRAHVGLLNCRLEQGWKDFEWRVQASGGPAYISDPRDAGTVLPRPSSLLPFAPAGKRILLMRDQGIGDDIFYLRFAPVLKARGAWIAHLASPKTATLLRRSPALGTVITDGPVPLELDVIALAPEAAMLAGCNRLQDIPPPLPLVPLPERIAKLRACLDALGPGPWLGVTWRAGVAIGIDGEPQPQKEVPLGMIARALSGWFGGVLALQRQPRAGEIGELSLALGRAVADFSHTNEDLEDMLALLSLIMEYAGVGNTNMHLRASLGKNARVLLQTPPPAWRWLARGDESPWFPGFKLYREVPGQQWSRAIADLARDIAAAAPR